MAPAVDSAILEALDLDASTTTMRSHGGSGFASTFKLSTTVDGQPTHYFVKTGRGANAEIMFRGEHASLNAIADVVPNFCPRAYAHGAMRSATDTFFLVTDFLQLVGPSFSSSSCSGPSLAAKLAQLHTTPAPIPPGHSSPVFGFPVATCCGATAQDNTWCASWADFYANRRLRYILRVSAGNHDGEEDAALADAVDMVAERVVPRLLGSTTTATTTVPVVVHGDLWSGNHARGRFASQRDGDGGGGGGGDVGEVVYDPSAVYGHAEYELGIMRMFGGFGREFWEEFHRLVPKAEPRDEWEDRVSLYELYHHLNHFAMFGGGYRDSAMNIMKRLISKYAG